jgi:hypothetical protein
VSAKVDASNGPFIAMRAGCNSDGARVHVLAEAGAISLAADTLEVKARWNVQTGNQRAFEPGRSYGATGDGLTVVTGIDSMNSSMTFAADRLGLRPEFFGTDWPHFPSTEVSVSRAFVLTQDVLQSCANADGKWAPIRPERKRAERPVQLLVPNAPVVIEIAGGDRASIPPLPPKAQCYGFFDSEPFAEVPVPELGSFGAREGAIRSASVEVCFHVATRRLGLLTEDRKNWMVREAMLLPDRKQPVLLNWPDTALERGGEFRFAPALLSPAKLQAELLGPKEPVTVTVTDRDVSFRVAENELASLLLLKLRLVAPDGASVVYPIPVHVQGAPVAIAQAQPGNKETSLAGASFKWLSMSKAGLKALPSTFYHSADPVQEIHGPIAGHLVFSTTAQRLDVFSLAAKKLVGSVAVSDKTRHYAGAGALFEYDQGTRALTRIELPDGRRSASMVVPANFTIRGLGVGAERGNPMTLFLQRLPGGEPVQPGAGFWNFDARMVVLNSDTLQPAPWMQPQFWAEKPDAVAMKNVLDGAMSRFGVTNFPALIPSSRNGHILGVTQHLLVVSPRYSYAIPYPNEGFRDYSGYNQRVSGSLTGIITARDSKVFKNGVPLRENPGGELSPCGRYTVCRSRASEASSFIDGVDFETLEGKKQVLTVARIMALHSSLGSDVGERHLRLAGDTGPLLASSPDRRLFQFVDFDLPKLAHELAPTTFHVSSQPQPIVFENGAYAYPIQVNNPAQVASFKLRSNIPNSAISMAGVLHFRAPPQVRTPAQVDFAVEIVGKQGQTVLHEFPVILLPRTKESATGGSGLQPARPL